MNDQTVDLGDGTQDPKKSKTQKRNENRRRRKAMKTDSPKQETHSLQHTSELSTSGHAQHPPRPRPPAKNLGPKQRVAQRQSQWGDNRQMTGYQSFMSGGPGLLGMGSPSRPLHTNRNPISQIQQSRRFHPNPAARPATSQPADEKSQNLDNEFDKLNLSNNEPWLMTSDLRVPFEKPDLKYLSQDNPDRLKLSKKWVPENPADAAVYRDGWTQRDHNMSQIELPPPVPTEEYLRIAHMPTNLVNDPAKRKLLVILDLNGTLLCRVRMLNGSRDKYNPWPRTNLPPFLDYIFREHYVAIFSSAMQGTILNLLKATVPREHRSRILKIFTREDMDIPRKYFKMKVSTFKRLSMVWDALIDQDSDWQFDQTNTILMDDSTEKASSEPYNHLLVPEYTVDIHNAGGDHVLGNIAGYLEEARKWENVSSYIRENPFDRDRSYPEPEGWVPSMEVYTPGLTFRHNHGYVPEEQFPFPDS